MVALLSPERVSLADRERPPLPSVRKHVDKAQRFTDAGMLEEALREDETARDLAPDDAYVWNNLGVTQAHLGRLDDALASFTRAVELQPDHPVFLRHKAFALVESDQASAALDILKLKHPIVDEARRAILDFHLRQLAKRGVVSWSGSKPKGSKNPVKISPGPPVSDYVIQDRR